MTTHIRVLIADDHAVVRKGLRTLLMSEPDIELIDEAADGVEAVLKARTCKPDVILLDMLMPRLDGLGAIQQIKQENPSARIVVLTSFAEDNQVFPAIKAGALGYLLKDSAPEQLVLAIRDVYNGKSSLDPSIAFKLIRELNRPSMQESGEEPLSERELEVLRCVAQGRTNGEIADELCISERTVGNHIGSILGKLHLANRTQAALYALRTGLAKLEAKAC
jgi:two-component system, NarL family, response regulator LiaR